MKKDLVIFGGAEIAALAKFYFNNDSPYNVVAFTIDDEFIASDNFEGIPILPFSECSEKFPTNEYSMHVALSYNKLNKLREEKYNQAKSVGYTLVNYISSKATIWNDLTLGDNCFILEEQNIQPFVKIGNNVMLWSGNHIGHGTVISDHTYISSHVVLSGNCEIGRRCFFGVNSTSKDFVKIGDDVFIGMDASITKDIADGAVVISSGTVVYEKSDRIAKAIKKSYFGI